MSVHPDIVEDTPLNQLPRGVIYTSPPPTELFDYHIAERPLTAFEITCNAHAVVDSNCFPIGPSVDEVKLAKAIDVVHERNQCMSLGVKYQNNWWWYFKLDAEHRPSLQVHEEVLTSKQQVEEKLAQGPTLLSTHSLSQWHLYRTNITSEENGFNAYSHVLLFITGHSVLGGAGLLQMAKMVNMEYTGQPWEAVKQSSPSLPALINPEGLEVPELGPELKDTPVRLFPYHKDALYTSGQFREPDTPSKPEMVVRRVPKTSVWRHREFSLSTWLTAVTMVHSTAYNMLECEARKEPVVDTVKVGFSIAIIMDWIFKAFGEDGWGLLGNNFIGTPSSVPSVSPETTVKEMATMVATIRSGMMNQWKEGQSPEQFLKAARAGLSRPVEVSEKIHWAWSGYFVTMGMISLGDGPILTLFGNANKGTFMDPASSAFIDMTMVGDRKSGTVMLTVDSPDVGWPASHGGEVMIDQFFALLEMCKEKNGEVTIREMMDVLRRDFKL
eukprot:gnl/Dysnectes_brevis/2988_a3682_1244.p1 GENE.gnl/Dysnectes_brevis/2988_a3682_1244~~gnl/Dysnectes_brevis/2988_a3682_1244.p1  ORF type:complete len:512 (+),score=137.45 gnl/Dysnectes_brevis/2988_a3682_1244:45-1538(+)